MGNMNMISTVNEAADNLTHCRRAIAAIDEFLETLSPEDREKEAVKQALEVIDKARFTIEEARRFIGNLSV